MSLPKNKRGFRRIVVNSKNYDWRYFHWSEKPVVDIRLAAKPRNKLTVDLDYEDPWLQNPENINLHNLHPCSSPITPKFVANAIKKSLDLGWCPEMQKQFNVKYRGGKFLLKKEIFN